MNDSYCVYRAMIQFRILQNFLLLKISPMAHTYCDKNFAEFNFANCARYPPESSVWIDSTLKKLLLMTHIGEIGENFILRKFLHIWYIYILL